jgi:hypothetical protein
MSNEARCREPRDNSTAGQVVPATHAATTRTLDRATLENQQQLLRHFLTPPSPKVTRSSSVKKMRKTDKTILTGTQSAQLLKEFAKAKSAKRPMNWTELSKRSVFQNHFTPEVLRSRALAFWKTRQEEEEHKKRVNMTRMSILNTFIQASNEHAKMIEVMNELQSEMSKLKIEVQATTTHSCDSEKVAADAAAQIEKLRLDLAKAENMAESTKLRQQELEKDIVVTKAALQSTEHRKLKLDLDLERKAELDELKTQINELHNARAVQEVEAAKIAKEQKDQLIWISGLTGQLDIQAAIATKAKQENERLKKDLAGSYAELELVNKRLKATEDTMEWITIVEKAVKKTALHIDDCMGLNNKRGYKNGK